MIYRIRRNSDRPLDLIKYQEMAYNTPRGLKWKEKLREPKFWNQWQAIVQQYAPREIDVIKYAHDIVIFCEWHFGYVQDYKKFNESRFIHAVKRLRQDTSPRLGANRFRAYASLLNYLPEEFYWFDNFLEEIIRPEIFFDPQA